MTKMRWNSGRRRRQSGVVIILLSLMLCTVLMPMVGLAIDLTVMYIVKAKLSAAVDSAVLAGGRSLVGSQTLAAQQSQVTQIALDLLNANMPAGYWGTLGTPTVLTPPANIVTQDANNRRILVTLTATVKVPTMFMQYIQPNMTVAASAVAARRYLRMVIVVDRSSSMVGAPIAELKLALSNTNLANGPYGFVQDFFEGQDDLGLVVLGASAIVAYPPRDPTIAGGGGNGPDSNFKTISNPNMPTLINMIVDESNTASAEAITLAYKELQKNPQPLFYNVIVFFTDGLPNGVTAGFNGAAPPVFYAGDTGDTNTTSSSISGGSTCTNKNYTDYQAGRQMVGALTQWGGYVNETDHAHGLYAPMMTTKYPNLAYTTPAQDVQNYLSDPNLATKGTGDNLAVPAYSNNCTYAQGSPPAMVADSDLSSFPAGDIYGNSLQGAGYTASLNYHNNGNAQGIWTGPAAYRNPYQIGNISWNAAYYAAIRARGDTTLNPTFFCIGYTGDGGVDHALLKRIANTNQGYQTWAQDPQGQYLSTDYVPTSTTGQYYDAGPGGIAAAFQEVRSQILSLAM